MLADFSTFATVKNNLSLTFAPTLYPCVSTGGFIDSVLNPLRYNLLVVFARDRSILNQSIGSSVCTIDLGGMI